MKSKEILKNKFSEKLRKYGNFHDSKLKRITFETNQQKVILSIDYTYDDLKSENGEIVVPLEEGDDVAKYKILYRPAQLVFKGVSEMVIKTELDLQNAEIILSCTVTEKENQLTVDDNHICIEIILSSMSMVTLICSEFEVLNS